MTKQMETTKHIPGPWKYVHQVNSDYSHDIVKPGPNGFMIATCGKQRATSDILAANARLIAAAPELLEGVKQLIDSLRDNGHYCPIGHSSPLTRKTTCVYCIQYQLLEAAIRKAEGSE